MTSAIFGKSDSRPPSAWIRLAMTITWATGTCPALAAAGRLIESDSWLNRATMVFSTSVGLIPGWIS